MSEQTTVLRRARTGDLLSPSLLDLGRARRIDATAFVVPGRGDVRGYQSHLEGARADFAAWDGRVVFTDADDEPMHRVVVVDRYGQVYDAVDTPDADSLPDARALEEWFRFLATACPECGVLDDPVGRGWTP